MPNIVPPNPSQPTYDEKGLMTSTFMGWTQAITRLDPLIGSGSPEGAVDATQYREYIDTTGTAGNIKWMKMLTNIAGDTKKGWIKL